MPPKAKRGRGRGRGGKAAPASTPKKTPVKRQIKTEVDEDEPPVKLERVGSLNTQLKAAIKEVKSETTKKKRFKLDAVLADRFSPKMGIFEDFSCMLNQTNIGHNNNKFYVIQVAHDPSKKNEFLVFTKWGRVGECGMNNVETYDTKELAISGFEKKFKDKTKNKWSERDNFKAASGKYTMLEIDEESDDEDEPDGLNVVKLNDGKNCKTSLDCRTFVLIKLIFNQDMFVGQMVAMNLDVRKMPLGKLSKTQIAKGLEVLIEIEEAIKKKTKGSNLSELSSRFYTLVPHDFGRMVPPVINTESVVDQKKELMITLSDIELAQSLQKNTVKQEAIEMKHPLDEKYEKLDCKLEYLDKNLKEFKTIANYAKACTNGRNSKLLDVWRVDRKGEDKRFSENDKLGNRKLLWHGTNVAVVAAILKAGLRIMPHSGGRLGRGIYFASEHSKSAGYVGVHYGQFDGEKNIGFMFLTEVALGKESTNLHGDGSIKKAPPGFDSVVGRGWTEPDPVKNEVMKFNKKEVVVPIGKPIDQKEWRSKSSFSQSEYLVYKESQARIRYLLKFSF